MSKLTDKFAKQAQAQQQQTPAQASVQPGETQPKPATRLATSLPMHGAIAGVQFQKLQQEANDLRIQLAAATSRADGLQALADERADAAAELVGLQDRVDSLKAQLQDKEQELSKFDGAAVMQSLDPRSIKRSRWANRMEVEFDTKGFKELKDEIQNAGGNVQPIKVRAIGLAGVFNRETPDAPAYEIVFGHRRHQACLELGLKVNAIVEQAMSDAVLFSEMDRENRSRKNLSAYEQGRMYKEAIEAGLFASQRKLSEALGVNLSVVSRAISLADLPTEIVNAFASPLDLQVRFSKQLADALASDRGGVLARAKAIKKKGANLTPAEVMATLTAARKQSSVNEEPIAMLGKNTARLKRDGRGKVSVEFDSLDAGQLEQLREFLKRL